MLHVPAAAARAAAVVCHPHPQYGGDMDNPVVTAVVDALVAGGMAALRFNFGGVGRSQGAYDDGREEQCDVGAAEAALAARIPGVPLALVGYSFGAWVGAQAAVGLPRVRRVVVVAPPLSFFDFAFVAGLRRPLDVVVGDRDQYCATDALARFVAAHGARSTVLRGADHFFGGVAARAGSAVADFLADLA